MSGSTKKLLTDVEKKVGKIATKPGAMTEGAKQGFEIMLNELSKFRTEMNGLRTEVNNLFTQGQGQNARLDTIEKTNVQMLEMMNKLNDKLEVNNIEQKAAVMDAFQKVVSTKIGKIILFLFLLCGGLAMAYIVEHAAGVSQIVESVK